MERLFRQRMEYVEDLGATVGCFLCDYRDSTEDRMNRILHRSGGAMLLLNAYPYNTGHLMAATTRHVASIEELDVDETREVMQLVNDAIVALRKAFSPEGFNIGANLGSAAGAGVPSHFHMHIVPRWNGDTNFMPVVAGSKVLPQMLEETYARLEKLFG
ncbi:MAG: HIT domain-containing protein [Actinomycetota bacterium]